MESGVLGLGFRVQGLGFGVWASGSRVNGLGSGVYRGTSLIRHNAPLGPYSRDYAWSPTAVLGGGAVSYERGTSVGFTEKHRGSKRRRPWDNIPRALRDLPYSAHPKPLNHFSLPKTGWEGGDGASRAAEMVTSWSRVGHEVVTMWSRGGREVDQEAWR